MPANAAVRPARKACTPRRTPASARRIDSSAVRFACSDVRPSVTPSTPATVSVAATKIFAPSPSRTVGLVALASGIRRVIFAVFVLVRHPAEAARVELHLDLGRPGRTDRDLPYDLRSALVPHVQPVAAGGDAIDREAPVGRGLTEIAARHHHDERDHAWMDVAEHAHQAWARERPAL